MDGTVVAMLPLPDYQESPSPYTLSYTPSTLPALLEQVTSLANEVQLLRIAIERLTMHLVKEPPQEWSRTLEESGTMAEAPSSTLTPLEADPEVLGLAEELREEFIRQRGRDPEPEELVRLVGDRLGWKRTPGDDTL